MLPSSALRLLRRNEGMGEGTGGTCRERVCCPRLVARELSVLFAICFGDRECAVTKFYGRRT
jgi:hypothetical protein